MERETTHPLMTMPSIDHGAINIPSKIGDTRTIFMNIHEIKCSESNIDPKSFVSFISGVQKCI